MRKYIYWGLAILLLCPIALAAQIKGEGGTNDQGHQILSLRQCVEMAIGCSSDILQRRADSVSAQLELAASQHQFLPRVEASLSQSFNFGRSEDASSIVTNHSAASSNFSIGASYVLFSGLRRLNDQAEAKSAIKASESALQATKDLIAIDVIGMYYQVLMHEDMMKVSLANIDMTRDQLAYTKGMVEAGKWALAKQVEIEAQLANEEVELIDRQNNLYLTRLNLALNVDYSDEDSLAIITPDIEKLVEIAYSKLLSPREIYQYAMSHRAEIDAVNQRIAAAKTAIATAKTGFIPSISLNAGYNTSYFYPFEESERQMMPDFSRQLSNNGRYFIGITLAIPLFDAMQTPTAIRRAEVRYTLAQIDHKRTREALNRKILTARANALAASKKIPAARQSAATTKQALEMTVAAFEAGRSTTLELEQAKNRSRIAEMQLIQAKYDFAYKAAILEHYMGSYDLWQ